MGGASKAHETVVNRLAPIAMLSKLHYKCGVKLLEPISFIGCQLLVFRCYSSPWFSAIVTSHDLSTRVSDLVLSSYHFVC